MAFQTRNLEESKLAAYRNEVETEVVNFLSTITFTRKQHVNNLLFDGFKIMAAMLKRRCFVMF